MTPKQIFEIAEIAREYGINSALHLASFFVFASEEGKTLPEVVELYDFEDYRSASAALRKMMNGDLGRSDGLKLFNWVLSESHKLNNVTHRNRPIQLTERGAELKAKIDAVMLVVEPQVATKSHSRYNA